MAQHDYDIANAAGATVRSDINSALEAIASNNSGGSAPSVTFPHMWWFDTANNLLKQRNDANTAWVTAAKKNASGWTPYFQGSELAAMATKASVGTSELDDEAVTYAKLQHASAASRLLGRGAGSGAGDIQEITLGAGLSLSGTTLSSSATSPFSAGTTLGPYTPSSAGSESDAHSLGGLPNLVQARLSCVSGEHGYSTGDVLIADNHSQATGPDGERLGQAITITSTNVNIRFGFGQGGNVYQAHHKTDGTTVTLTNANWRLYVKVWR